MTTIRTKYDVLTILLGDFNVRTGTTFDFEYMNKINSFLIKIPIQYILKKRIFFMERIKINN